MVYYVGMIVTIDIADVVDCTRVNSCTERMLNLWYTYSGNVIFNVNNFEVVPSKKANFKK